jgi:hypothetical protein
MSDEEDTATVVCGAHGETAPRYACHHVAIGIACGWHTGDSEKDENDDDSGWCDYCEERLVAADDWTPELIAEMRLLCTQCFANARDRNRKIPPLGRGRTARLTDDELHDLIHGACEHTQRLQQQAHARWNIGSGGDGARWHYDDEKRTVTFSDAGTPTVIADARMVGSYSTKSESFQWAWVLYEAGDPVIRGVDGLPAFGEVRGIDKLTTNYWSCEIVEAWEMTSLAAYLVGCDAVYRAPFDDLYWFMLLENFRYPA